MIGLEAGIDGVGAPDAAKEQGGDDQAQQRESNLADHERVSEAESSRAASCCGRFFFQSRGHVGAGSAQRRGQPEQGGRDEGNEHREAQHATVELRRHHIVDVLGWDKRPHEVAPRISQAHTGDAAHEAQQRAFSQQLPDQPAAARTDGQP